MSLSELVFASVLRRKQIPNFALATAAAIVLGLFAAAPAPAQVEGATLRGEVASPAGPQAGVSVLAIHIATGQTRRATAGTDGSYVMVGLRPGTYQVQVVGAAAQPEELTLRVGQTATIDFEIAARGEDIEEIVVTGTQVELFEGGAVGTSVTPELIQRLPQVDRNFLSFAELAPGVQFVQRDDGSTSIRGGAQHQRAVNIFIDGVSQKDYVLKGGITGQDTSQGNPFPQSAISEYKVITQNYKAEYPHVASTAITAVTASGTTNFTAAHSSTLRTRICVPRRRSKKSRAKKSPSSSSNTASTSPVRSSRTSCIICSPSRPRTTRCRRTSFREAGLPSKRCRPSLHRWPAGRFRISRRICTSARSTGTSASRSISKRH